jgi:hypothetical protein
VAAEVEEVPVVLLVALEQQIRAVAVAVAHTRLPALQPTAEMVDQVLLSLGIHQTHLLPRPLASPQQPRQSAAIKLPSLPPVPEL